jgi:hypothetical protein
MEVVGGFARDDTNSDRSDATKSRLSRGTFEVVTVRADREGEGSSQ